MKSKMLIDAAHPEETRVVVVDGNRVEEFDYESAHRKQLKGNIYLAKVTRVEPSLQAAFVDFGGNRHGFLAFNEIHPDYYQIPIADRQALLEEEAEEESRAQAEEDAEADAAASGRKRRGRERGRRGRKGGGRGEETPRAEATDANAASIDESAGTGASDEADTLALEAGRFTESVSEDAPAPAVDQPEDEAPSRHLQEIEEIDDDDDDEDGEDEDEAAEADASGDFAGNGAPPAVQTSTPPEAIVESVGSEDALEELPDRPRARRRRSYKIQEVIKRRQIILVQVVKEERGNKGAALTTYLSLAGRYTVLMPNTARGGGISRKITTPTDRKRLREIAGELEVPEGMGLIIRTAGAQRTKTEIKRDYDYLLRLWETVRDLTLRSSAPALVYEEGSLIKRSIRDLYNKDIDAVLVAGDEAYREAKDFMRMLMPSHAKNVQLYKEPEPLFIRYQVERHLAAMFSPKVVLKSGGYIVINQTEALVSIDVNSGRATREHNIEDTALKTNLEASDEIARQLRLRDLAGLVVIDFIDMDERRNPRAVERRLKDALRNDRARIQVGRISHFGLLEMSRQRLRVGMLEGSTSPCAICQGTGIVRSTESVALDVLRSIEDSLLTEGPANLCATTSVEAALYILNHKRSHLRDLEQRYSVDVSIEADSGMHGAQFTLQRSAAALAPERISSVVQMDWAHHTAVAEPVDAAVVEAGDDETAESDDAKRDGRKRRRRRGRGRGDDAASASNGRDAPARVVPITDSDEGVAEGVLDEPREAIAAEDDEGSAEDHARKPRRRGRRGGRRARGRRQNGNGVATDALSGAEPGALTEDEFEDEVASDEGMPEPRVAETDGVQDDAGQNHEEPAEAEHEHAAYEDTKPADEPLHEHAVTADLKEKSSPRRGWWQRRG